MEVVLVDKTPPGNVHQRFDELKQRVSLVIVDEGYPKLFITLTLEKANGTVWLVHVITNEIPSIILRKLEKIVDEISQAEDDFSFCLTLDSPK